MLQFILSNKTSLMRCIDQIHKKSLEKPLAQIVVFIGLSLHVFKKILISFYRRKAFFMVWL